jgi:hypothetical protein
MDGEPLDAPRARALLAGILAGGALRFSRHAMEEMA